MDNKPLPRSLGPTAVGSLVVSQTTPLHGLGKGLRYEALKSSLLMG